jgi:CelD/BcsL family acetyltransferase involved in cellulose biosynthesis
MRVECLPARRLVEADWSAWDDLQSRAPSLSSPYFSSAFCKVVAESSPDLFVACLSDGQGSAGFFPFHRSRWGTGWPLARSLSGYQGIIGREHLAIEVAGLLKCCALKTFDFARLPATQTSFLPFARGTDASHTMDLHGGFDDYAARVGRSSAILAATARRKRRLEREIGRVRFEQHIDDSAAFRTLTALKATQYRRTGARDPLADPCARAIVEAVFRCRGPALSGVLSVLFVADQVAALLLGLRRRKALHGWFHAYDPRFAKYSPGILLLVELARAAPASGIEVIDLGTGEQAYKTRLATGAVNVVWGRVERPSLVAVWRAARRNLGRLAGCRGS